jgi:hypothetical protein
MIWQWPLRGLIVVLAVCALGISLPVSPLQQIAATKRPIDTGYSQQTAYHSANQHLDRLQDFFPPTLEANKKEFLGQVGFIKGFGAGSGYPQIWLRDSATIIPLSRYYYPLEYLTTWLEEHLAYQDEHGQLYDWLALGEAANFLTGAPKVREVYSEEKISGERITISADKNDVAADQEASAVDAAYQVFKITGDRNWLNKKIRGKTLLERLDLSLEYLLKHRFDSSYGLITNAFTADWGDVSPVYEDQRCIYLDEKTPLVVGLYTNSLFYHAAGQLEEMYQRLAKKSRADYWRQQAAMIKDHINKHLWQEDRGFYRMHLVLTPNLAREWQDDSDIFAMGGNGLAVLYGIANDGQAQRIFAIAEERQRKFGVSTIASVLLPPYPKGFFKHPVMREEYRYQNGGQWDWFAGRFLLAEFESGYSQQAYRQLIEIARKDVDHHGLYEWDTKEDKGNGSPNFAGSAGALAGAIFQGLFGTYLSAGALNLKIRLGDQPGQIHLYQPATDIYVAYQYSYDGAANVIKLRYESNFSRAGGVSILLPKNQRAEELLLDGKKESFIREAIGEDAYVNFSTDWKPHQLELKLKGKREEETFLHIKRFRGSSSWQEAHPNESS